MIPSKPLSKTKRSKIEADTAAIKQAQERKKAKDSQSVRKYYEAGGKLFVEAVRKYGRTERGQEIRLTDWYAEYLELLGDYRVHEVVISGCSQIGKSLAVNLLLCYSLCCVKLNVLSVFDKAKTLERNVPLQFRPLVTRWIERMGEHIPIGKESNSLFQYGAASAIFSYVSTSRPTAQRQGLATAGSAVVSVTADLLITDERSQFPPGTADPLPRRLDASSLPSKPQRHAGTPGSGSGTESLIEQCKYNFYPFCYCDKCGALTSLHPLGALLRPIKKMINGKEKEVYFSESGRPLFWFRTSEEHPIETAYVGCQSCLQPLSDEARINAHFRCLNSNITLREFLDSVS